MLNRQPRIAAGRLPRHERRVPGTVTLLGREHEIPAVVIRQVVELQPGGPLPR